MEHSWPQTGAGEWALENKMEQKKKAYGCFLLLDLG